MITNGLLITFQCLVNVFALIEMRYLPQLSCFSLFPLTKVMATFFPHALYTTRCELIARLWWGSHIQSPCF